MTGAIKALTSRLALRKLWFNFPNWGDDMNSNMDIIDGLAALTGIVMSGPWDNSTAYVYGQIIVDVVDNSVWRCLVPHTSAATGTFAADRVLHPTFWGILNSPISARGAWTTATQYYPNDIVQNGTQYAICITAHVSGVYATDLAAGKWAVISDAVGGQPADATLTALAALNATAGILYQTAADTFTKRVPLGTGNEVTITNGDGVAGAPVWSLPAALTFTGKTITNGTYSSPTINSPVVSSPTVSNPTTSGTQTSDLVTYADGRLTLETAVAVSTTDQTAKTTLFYTPYRGNVISLYNGSTWVDRKFTQLSITLAGLTAGRPYDVFVYDNAGVATLELLVWTSDTARATALVKQDGVWCLTGTLTRRYVGTIRINAAGGQCEDTKTQRFVWNAYNRVLRHLKSVDEAAASWNYTIATIRQANANVANQVDFVRGLDEDVVDCMAFVGATNATASTVYKIGIGLDSTTTFSADGLTGFGASFSSIWAKYVGLPGIGKHSLMWNETSAVGGTTTWQGFSAGVQHIGMRGTVFA